MKAAHIYFKENMWCVDFMDENYDVLPTVGMFFELEQARQASLEWCDGNTDNVRVIAASKGSWQ